MKYEKNRHKSFW